MPSVINLRVLSPVDLTLIFMGATSLNNFVRNCLVRRKAGVVLDFDHLKTKKKERDIHYCTREWVL